MPEGDTIHYAARRIRAVLEGHVPDEILTPHPRFARDQWPEQLAGRRVTGVDAVGKHLLLRFEGGLVIHSHLRMHGRWRVVPADERWRRSRGTWLVIRWGAMEVVQSGGPVLELTTAAHLRLDPRLARLGPDIVAHEPFDEERYLRRLRADDPTRPVGEALLDQHTVAGIGNVWKVEGCFLAGLDPWWPIGKLTDEEALAIIAALRPRMQASAQDGHQSRFTTIHGNSGSFCPRCGPPVRIRARHQGDDNRITYWCPSCQRRQRRPQRCDLRSRAAG
jgi:endonuclease-8